MAERIEGLGPIAKRKLSDEVTARLEAAIRDGTFPPGKTLPSERELMALFNVGRPSIREALFALQKIGVVRIVSGERPVVVRPTPRHMLDQLGASARHLLEQPDAVRNFDEARVALELYLVRHAARNGKPAQIERLRHALAENERAIGDGPLFAKTDVGFHRVLAEMPGNPIFLAMHDAIVEWVIDQRPSLADPQSNNRMSYAGHLSVFDAIAKRDVESACAALERHLADAYNRYLNN
jgi:GntR family transcriptional regulator, sialic acid-inducible nan operon repressor